MVGPGGIPGTPDEVEDFGGLVYVPMLAGPSIAGLLLIRVLDGRRGLRELWARLSRWRVGFRWYLVAAVPILVTALVTLLSLSLVFDELRPEFLVTDENLAVFLLSPIFIGIAVGVFEEVGWTGFATPRLMRRYSILTTGLLLGVVWGVWHLLLFAWTSGDASGALDLGLFVPAAVYCLAVLPAMRVFMVWVYARTESLLLVVVAHAFAVDAVALYLIPLEAEGGQLLAWYSTFAIALAALDALVLRRGLPGARQTTPTPRLHPHITTSAG